MWPIDVEERVKRIKEKQKLYKADSNINRHGLPEDSYKQRITYPEFPNQFRNENSVDELSTERLHLGEDKFILPSDSDIYDLYKIDVAYAEAEDEFEYFYDSDYPSKSSAYSKWSGWCSNCKYCWDLINDLSDDRFFNLLCFLSHEGYPNTGGRPSKECELAISIRYDMTPKQRKVAYDIIRNRFYNGRRFDRKKQNEELKNDKPKKVPKKNLKTEAALMNLLNATKEADRN